MRTLWGRGVPGCPIVPAKKKVPVWGIAAPSHVRIRKPKKSTPRFEARSALGFPAKSPCGRGPSPVRPSRAATLKASEGSCTFHRCVEGGFAAGVAYQSDVTSQTCGKRPLEARGRFLPFTRATLPPRQVVFGATQPPRSRLSLLQCRRKSSLPGKGGTVRAGDSKASLKETESEKRKPNPSACVLFLLLRVMAAGNPTKRLQEEATCSVCLDFFTDPVILECGHNFCRSCVRGSWGDSAAEDASCPRCRQRAPRGSLKPNRRLANVVAIAKELSARAGPEGGGRVCEWHQEPLKLFCRDDEAPVCVVCDRSKEHRGHEVVPLQEVAEEYKDLIQEQIDVMRKQKDEMAGAKRNSKLESQSLLRQINAERQKVVAEFQELQQLMEGRKRLLLARLGELDKKVSKRRDEHNAELSKESTSLDNLIQELEEKCQQPASELLQDVKNTLQRCNILTPQISVAFPPEIKRQIEEFSNINNFLHRVVTQFRDTLLSEYQLWKEDIVLDPDTAHPDLSLSMDHRSVRLLPSQQKLANNLERFDTSICVLGREGFITGRHFWEVEVEERGVWAVGVAVRSVKRKGPISLCPEEGIWAVGQSWGGHYQALTTRKHHLLLNRKLRKIRVTVDYENGQVAFLDPDTESPIFMFPAASFKGEEVLPWFWVGGMASKLRLSL